MASIGSIPSTLATDLVAEKQAKADATKASAQLSADQKAKVTADAIKADEAKVKSTEAAQKTANAKVLADQTASSGGVNITA